MAPLAELSSLLSSWLSLLESLPLLSPSTGILLLPLSTFDLPFVFPNLAL